MQVVIVKIVSNISHQLPLSDTSCVVPWT